MEKTLVLNPRLSFIYTSGRGAATMTQPKWNYQKYPPFTHVPRPKRALTGRDGKMLNPWKGKKQGQIPPAPRVMWFHSAFTSFSPQFPSGVFEISRAKPYGGGKLRAENDVKLGDSGKVIWFGEKGVCGW